MATGSATAFSAPVSSTPRYGTPRANRPGEYGGATAGDPRNAEALRSFGMSPERVGRLVVAGIAAEDPYIWTHPQDIELIETRYRECRNTLLRQWPNGPDAEHRMTPHEVG